MSTHTHTHIPPVPCWQNPGSEVAKTASFFAQTVAVCNCKIRNWSWSNTWLQFLKLRKARNLLWSWIWTVKCLTKLPCFEACRFLSLPMKNDAVYCCLWASELKIGLELEQKLIKAKVETAKFDKLKMEVNIWTSLIQAKELFQKFGLKRFCSIIFIIQLSSSNIIIKI